MENEQDAKYYAEKIVKESRHKFIYAYKDNRELLIQNIIENYPIVKGDTPSALYMKIVGLPNINSEIKDLNKNTISIINREYLNFSIASNLMEKIITSSEFDIIKERKNELLRFINHSLDKENITDLELLPNLFKEAKEMYYELYLNYLQYGALKDYINESSISFLELENFIHYVKKLLEKKGYISFVLEHDEQLSLDSYKAINNLIGSRINSDISVNIITEPGTWKSYNDQNGQLIESIHDYEDVEYDESFNKHLERVMKKHIIY